MQFSERMAHIKPSATLTINAKALELKSQGVDVTSLAIGEPNFATPPPVRRAPKHAIAAGGSPNTPRPRIPRPCLRRSETGYRRGLYPLHRRARHPAPAGSHRRLL